MNEQCMCEHGEQVIKPAVHDAESVGQPEAVRQQELERELGQCREEVDRWKERVMRVTADLENFRRRTEKEQTAWIRASKVAVLRNLLPVIDDVERAMADYHTREHTPESTSLLVGLELIVTAFRKFLKESEVTEITDVDIFDPLLHEAIVHVESPEHESGQIVEVLQKGYLFGDHVLRPAKVSVAR